MYGEGTIPCPGEVHRQVAEECTWRSGGSHATADAAGPREAEQPPRR
jgi:hypothetical protein